MAIGDGEVLSIGAQTNGTYYQYLYEDATGCIFMNQETFEQVPIAKENVTGVRGGDSLVCHYPADVS